MRHVLSNIWPGLRIVLSGTVTSPTNAALSTQPAVAAAPTVAVGEIGGSCSVATTSGGPPEPVLRPWSDHSFTCPPTAPAPTVLPSGAKAMETSGPISALIVRRAAPSAARHSRAAPSAEAEASRVPSGEKATPLTSAWWPCRVRSRAPSATRYSRTTPSAEPTASAVLSGEKATVLTWPGPTLMVRTGLLVLTCHNMAVPSPLPEASSDPLRA